MDIAAALEGDDALVSIPEGSHVIDRPVTIRRARVIEGLGARTRLTIVGDGQLVPAASHIDIRRMHIKSVGDRPAIETPSGPGRGIYGLRLTDLRIDAKNCIRLTDTAVTRITDCDILADGGVGLDVDGGEYDVEGAIGEDDNNHTVRVQNSRFGGTKYGPEVLARLTGAAHAKFLMADFNFGAVGLEIRKGALHEPKFTQLIGCGFENHAAEALKINGGRMIRVTDLYASHDSMGAHSVVYFGREFAGEAQITGGYVRGGARDGIRVVAGHLVQIASVQCGNNGRCVPGDGIRAFPWLRKLRTANCDWDAYSDGMHRQRHPHKIEAQEWVSC